MAAGETATIEVDFANLDDVKQQGQAPRDNNVINPLTLTQYLLGTSRYTETNWLNYGIGPFSQYEGFMTVGNKNNIKRCCLCITGPLLLTGETNTSLGICLQPSKKICTSFVQGHGNQLTLLTNDGSCSSLDFNTNTITTKAGNNLCIVLDGDNTCIRTTTTAGILNTTNNLTNVIGQNIDFNNFTNFDIAGKEPSSTNVSNFNICATNINIAKSTNYCNCATNICIGNTAASVVCLKGSDIQFERITKVLGNVTIGGTLTVCGGNPSTVLSVTNNCVNVKQKSCFDTDVCIYGNSYIANNLYDTGGTILNLVSKSGETYPNLNLNRFSANNGCAFLQGNSSNYLKICGLGSNDSTELKSNADLKVYGNDILISNNNNAAAGQTVSICSRDLFSCSTNNSTENVTNSILKNYTTYVGTGTNTCVVGNFTNKIDTTNRICSLTDCLTLNQKVCITGTALIDGLLTTKNGVNTENRICFTSGAPSAETRRIIGVRRVTGPDDIFSGSSQFLNDPIAIGDFKNFAFQTGMIIMFSGTIQKDASKVLLNPSGGWALCDGETVQWGTPPAAFTPPDLRGRFIVGIGTYDGETYNLGSTGGNNKTTLNISNLPAHNHLASQGNIDGKLCGSTYSENYTDGSHTHTATFKGDYNTGGGNPSGLQTGDQQEAFRSPGGTPSGSVTVKESTHSHNVCVSSYARGSGTSFENRPPYYALAYIIKL